MTGEHGAVGDPDSREQDLPLGSCFLLIRSPIDEQIYMCFRSLAQRWREHVTHQALWLEHDVPLDANLTSSEPSRAILKLLRARASIIARIELTIGGLNICFVRSGGLGPEALRQSFFDELRVDARSVLLLPTTQVESLISGICCAVDAVSVAGRSALASIFERNGVPIRGQAAALDLDDLREPAPGSNKRKIVSREP